jgi:hypothetical protein
MNGAQPIQRLIQILYLTDYKLGWTERVRNATLA